MRRHELIVGEVFGRLTVIAEAPRVNLKIRRLSCRCECGSELSANRNSLRSGHTKSCGCLSKELTSARRLTHGMSDSLEYEIWQAMLNRCTNKNCKSFSYYGGRGISVAPEWRDFEVFLADMGCKPEGLTLERLDVDGNYCRENCTWADKLTQANNRRSNVRVTLSGERVTVAQAARKTGLSRATLRSRMTSLNWPEADWFKPAKYKGSSRITLDGKPTTLAATCRELNLSRKTVNWRVWEGWPEEDWFKPVGYKRNKPTKVTI